MYADDEPTVLLFPLYDEALDLGPGLRDGPGDPGLTGVHRRQGQVLRALGGL